MKLLIVTLHADPTMPPGVSEWGGTHTYMRELLMGLTYHKDIDVLLITRKVFKDDPDIEVISENCKIIRLSIGSFKNFDKRELFFHHESNKQKILKLLKNTNFSPDIIHSVYWNSGQISMELSQELKIPFVHSVISNGKGRIQHGADGTSEHRIPIEEQIFAAAATILCVAESEKKEISELYQIDSNKIVVAGQYVHPSFITPSHNKQGNPRKSILNNTVEHRYFPMPTTKETPDPKQIWWKKNNFIYTGRISFDKGLDKIIEAWLLLFNKYKEECFSLWIVGGNPNEIESFRNKLSFQNELIYAEKMNKLIWWGYLDEFGISTLYLKSNVLLTHSRYEPGGRVAVEAMCEGLPVIATPNGFALDSIKNGINGFLTSFSNVSELSLRMEHFIKQPLLSTTLGKNAKKAGINIVEKNDFMNKHIDSYKKSILETIGQTILNQTVKENVVFEQTRILDGYPYNQLFVTEVDILEIFEKNGHSNLEKIERLKHLESSSMIWLVRIDGNDFYVKIPYDRMNNHALWADKNSVPLTTLSKQRFDAEIKALAFNGITPVTFYDKNRQAIVRKYQKSRITPSAKDQLNLVIKKLKEIYTHPTDHYHYIFDNIYQLHQQHSFHKIDDYYENEVNKNKLPLLQTQDYSLLIEIDRWAKYYTNLPEFVKQQTPDFLNQYAGFFATLTVIEQEEKIVFCHGGMDLKNLIFLENDIFLTDNERLHLGKVGIDFSDILITLSRKYNPKESQEWWHEMLNEIPESLINRKLLVGWIILGSAKEATSNAAVLNRCGLYLKQRCENLLKLL